MIKFFRRIRYNLMEKNKTGKYFKYAIGEIILVVIGILIALQFNNWNESRKREHLKNQYETSLKIDYVKDTIQLRERIIQNQKIFESLSEAFDELEKTTFKTSDEVLSKLIGNLGLNYRTLNTYNTNTFNLLISGGNIDLLDKEFQEAIMELNRLQLHELKVSTVNRESFIAYSTNFRIKHPPLKLRNESLLKVLHKDIDTKQIPKDLYTLLERKGYGIIRYLELSNKVLKQTRLVLTLLEDSVE
ncbi:DUF6090 family protein [Ichthyenterobacterium sp. W332]|uniref:DUF6090 family protein n=1 Tax=Microcosmobacter mediterraneus TaxID=3075607 RepID=A0ABU2YRA7_9FLAO|nr:DUF6090 family protein [Ichthyenterobacterium sp. W332]MDT0559603.1 DUF6090 family protein [Ichthyenterobacterium sp. W332]